MIQSRINGFVGLHSLALGVILCLCFVATLLVFHATEIVVLNSDANFELYALGLLGASYSIHRHMIGTARRYGRLTRRENFRLSAQQLTRVMLVLFAIAFVTKDTGVSRIFLGSFIVLTGVALLVGNLYLPRLLALLFVRDSIQRTVIVSSSATAAQLHHWLDQHSDLGFKLIGYISTEHPAGFESLPWLDDTSQLEEVIIKESVDQIFLDQTIFDRARGRELIAKCERHGCRVRSFVDIASLLPSATAAFEHDGRYAFATTTPEPLTNPMNQLSKRMLDIAISLPVVLVLLPLVLLATWGAQRFQSPGPLLYFQYRTGINRRRFRIIKIRTMHVAAQERVAEQATRNDPRIFPFGRFLRRTSLDELPQFFNVLLGDMSVSGPRPHLVEHDEEFSRLISVYRKRHFVKPGITGLAQSKGCRGEIIGSSTIFRRVRYDMYYIANWSLRMDLEIIASTVRQILFPPSSAY